MHRPNPASAENGRRSRGPITEEGKEKSRQAVLKHGLCAKTIVLLPVEQPELFDEDFKRYAEKLQPADDVEYHQVMNIAAANWRLGRAMGMEKALLTMNTHDTAYTENGADALLPVLDTARFHTLQVYIGRIERSQQRALNNLIKIRRHFAEVEEEPELDLSPETPQPVPLEIPPEPVAAEPVTLPETSEKPVQPRPSAPKALKKPFHPRNVMNSDSVAPAIPPDDWPKTA